MNWLPIETAPKDETEVLVMYVDIDTQCVFNAFYFEHEEGDDPENVGWWSYVFSEVSRSKIKEPTHWMPLPPMPKKKEIDMKWQPIETAPKDGSGFLVSCPHVVGGVSMMTWGDGGLVSLFNGLPWLPELSPPTHWMPLPPPLKGAAE